MKSGLVAHLYGRKREKGGMRPYYLLRQYGRNWRKTELRPCILLIATAAIGKRQNCGRAFRSSLRPQTQKSMNAAVRPSSPIRPQMKKDRAAAVIDTAAIGERRTECQQLVAGCAPASCIFHLHCPAGSWYNLICCSVRTANPCRNQAHYKAKQAKADFAI